MVFEQASAADFKLGCTLSVHFLATAPRVAIHASSCLDLGGSFPKVALLSGLFFFRKKPDGRSARKSER